MSVEIDPSELGFRRPFTVEVAQILRIKNPNASPVAFKVKTTAPKQYCVRPNSGRIEPDHEVEVTVLLQAMKQEPPLDTKCRDKFLVQSVGITGDKEFTNVQQIWDSVERSAIQEKKIRVVFLPADGGLSPAAAAAATPVRHSPTIGQAEWTPEPPLHSSQSEDNVPSTSSPVPREAAAAYDTKPEPEPELAETVVSRSSVASANTAAPAPAPAPASIPAAAAGDSTAVEDLQARLAQAEEVISSLKQEGGLRLRKGANAASEKVHQQVPQMAQAVRQGTEGVPVKIAAVLCLISFLLAYFLF